MAQPGEPWYSNANRRSQVAVKTKLNNRANYPNTLARFAQFAQCAQTLCIMHTALRLSPIKHFQGMHCVCVLVSLCFCACVLVCLFSFVFLCVCACVLVSFCVSVCVCACVRVSFCVSVRVCLFACVLVRLCACTLRLCVSSTECSTIACRGRSEFPPNVDLNDLI